MDCLIIGKVWPEPVSSAAGRRTQDILTALTSAGWSVHFASAAHRGAYAEDLEAHGVSTHSIRVNDAAFDSWVAALSPDIVIFDRFMTEEQFGWRVERRCPHALRVLDTSDLHCLRVAREQALIEGRESDLKNETALREIASIYRSDLTLMIANYELERLQREFALPDDLLAYWPFAVTLPEAYPSFEARSHCIMIGSFLHPPNLDAARWCRQAIWPQIREALPNVELHLYGSYGDRYGTELHAPEMGFHYKGRAEDALETMARYRLNLAPLRYGAGLKGKVFDGFLTGTPTVMSPIAGEGIVTGSDWVNAAPEVFAATAAELYQDATAWQQRQSAQRELCRLRFAASEWHPRLPQIIKAAIDKKDTRRAQNFIGRMLRHHHHRSTEFMSRWIEAKNQ